MKEDRTGKERDREKDLQKSSLAEEKGQKKKVWERGAENVYVCGDGRKDGMREGGRKLKKSEKKS